MVKNHFTEGSGGREGGHGEVIGACKHRARSEQWL